MYVVCCCFFFQAEDGIRDTSVTGVQTCALPIWERISWPSTPSSTGTTSTPASPEGGTGDRVEKPIPAPGSETRGQTGLPANFRQKAPEIHGSLVSPRGHVPADRARIQFIPGWRIDEKRTIGAVVFSLRAAFAGPGRAAAAGRRSALRNGVLLQGAMGASAGIPATLPEEPLPAAAEERAEWPHALGENRAAG